MGEETSPGEPSPARKATRAAKEAAKQGVKPWSQKPQAGVPDPDGITAADLAALEFAPPRFAVDGLLAEGLTVFGGRPKHGKSWLSLLLGWAVAAGCEVDGRAVLQGEVLYLALEDTRRRLQKRLLMLQTATGWVIPETLSLHTAWPRADQGGLYHVAEWLAARKKVARLVIVDTLAKFRKPSKGTGNGYAEDYEAVGGLKELLDHYETSGLLITHTRKLKAEDPFDEISGTLGIGGAADSIWVLDTQEKGSQARLYTTGRDLPDGTIPLAFGKDSGRWTLGETREGIDSAGRVEGKGEGRAAAARTWLRTFLKGFAYPAKEIDAAGLAAGHSRSAVAEAKTELGRDGTGELWFQKDGAGAWWAGLGPPANWKRRPTSGHAEGENGG